jgi:hypothetical protein
MGFTMKVIQDRKNSRPPSPDATGGRLNKTGIMHPDDFRAHLAWVTAKRFHER